MVILLGFVIRNVFFSLLLLSFFVSFYKATLFSVWPVYLDGELKIINYIASSVRNHSALTDETNASRGGIRPTCLNSSRLM